MVLPKFAQCQHRHFHLDIFDGAGKTADWEAYEKWQVPAYNCELVVDRGSQLQLQCTFGACE